MTTGERIRKYRKAAHLTQKELAKKVNLAEITIRQYEGNLYEPKQEAAKRIASVLGVSISDLMGWDEEIDVTRLSKEVKTIELTETMNNAFSRLNPAGQQKAVEYVNDLLQIDAYRLEE